MIVTVGYINGKYNKLHMFYFGYKMFLHSQPLNNKLATANMAMKIM